MQGFISFPLEKKKSANHRCKSLMAHFKKEITVLSYYFSIQQRNKKKHIELYEI